VRLKFSLASFVASLIVAAQAHANIGIGLVDPNQPVPTPGSTFDQPMTPEPAPRDEPPHEGDPVPPPDGGEYRRLALTCENDQIVGAERLFILKGKEKADFAMRVEDVAGRVRGYYPVPQARMTALSRMSFQIFTPSDSEQELFVAHNTHMGFTQIAVKLKKSDSVVATTGQGPYFIIYPTNDYHCYSPDPAHAVPGPWPKPAPVTPTPPAPAPPKPRPR
jgi:hypothetical protein